jgi:hypothetical protein
LTSEMSPGSEVGIAGTVSLGRHAPASPPVKFDVPRFWK